MMNKNKYNEISNYGRIRPNIILSDSKMKKISLIL